MQRAHRGRGTSLRPWLTSFVLRASSFELRYVLRLTCDCESFSIQHWTVLTRYCRALYIILYRQDIGVARNSQHATPLASETWRRITWAKSEHFPRFRSDPGRTHLSTEAPSAQIGRRSALEMDTPERTTQTASRNVVALKNRMGHQVDADGKLRRGSWQVDGGQLFPGCNDAAASAHR